MTISSSDPKTPYSYLKCSKCKSKEKITPNRAAKYQKYGWPKCCEETMELINGRMLYKTSSFIKYNDSFYKQAEVESLTLNDARKIISLAEKKAVEIKQPMNIAVVDAGGNLISHVRMDGAWIGSIDISIKKAFTSRAFDISTKDLSKESQPGKQFFGINESNDGKIMIFAGGIPIKRGEKVIGAIGVSGGTGDQDQEVAEAGISGIK